MRLRVALRFLLLGPLVGGMVFWLTGLFMLERMGSEPPEGLAFLSKALLGAPILVVTTYPVALLLGGVPALLTGLGYGYWLQRFGTAGQTPLRRLLLGGTMGLTAALLWTVTLRGWPLVDLGHDGVLRIWLAPGTVAGALCALSIKRATLQRWLNRTAQAAGSAVAEG